MNLRDKIGQMLMVGFHGLTAPDHILDWLREGKIGGVILFARNVENPQQLSDLCNSIHDAAKYPALIAIDQEGGMVARMREKQGFTESPGAMALSSAQNAEAVAEQVNRVLADEMAAMGINWTFAPPVDISYNAENPTVGTRSFGSDPQHVGRIASAAVRGFQAGGVAACAKHFPGLGDTAVDTHLALAVLDTPKEHLLENDLAPYRACIDAGLATIMTTHTQFTVLDDQHPATLSNNVIHPLLREELGFEGVVVSDCMEMKAIYDNYGAARSAVLGMLAGLDIILFSHTQAYQQDAYNAMLAAVEAGDVSEVLVDAANERIAALKAQFVTPFAPNQDAIGKEREAVYEATRATVTLVQTAEFFPLQPKEQHIWMFEFASYMDTEAMERDDASAFATIVTEKSKQKTVMSFPSTHEIEEGAIRTAKTFAGMADVVVVITRNAHMNDDQRQLAQELLDEGKLSVLIALRNPYDAQVLSADVVLCTCGDSVPSLHAAVGALFGEFTPSGTLPVDISG